MPSSCGQPVRSSSITEHIFGRLYTLLVRPSDHYAYKVVGFTPIHTQPVHQLTHSSFSHFTTVKNLLIPIIHTPNKNYKKFFIQKLLLIKRSTV